MGYVILPLLAGFIGFELALKMVLLTQVIPIIIAIFLFIRATTGGGLESVFHILWFLPFIIGVIIGDLYFYSAFYEGSYHFSLAWFFKP